MKTVQERLMSIWPLTHSCTVQVETSALISKQSSYTQLTDASSRDAVSSCALRSVIGLCGPRVRRVVMTMTDSDSASVCRTWRLQSPYMRFFRTIHAKMFTVLSFISECRYLLSVIYEHINMNLIPRRMKQNVPPKRQ
jgi:hypothetical protein